METANYNGILTANAGLENMLNFHQYNSLEAQINQIQAEPEDPPETMHTPWGIWRHYRDALHSIDERYDAEHLVRKSHPAEDILHEAHYVPVIGDHDHKEETYEMNIEYDDPIQLEVYNSKINLKYSAEIDVKEGMKNENTKISTNTETEDDSIEVESSIDEKPEEQSSDESQKKNFDLEPKKELTTNLRNIFKQVLKMEGFKWYYRAL